MDDVILAKLDALKADIAAVKTDVALIGQRLSQGDKEFARLPCGDHDRRINDVATEVKVFNERFGPARMAVYGAIGIAGAAVVGAVVAGVMR
jgi:hypothetical protein